MEAFVLDGSAVLINRCAKCIALDMDSVALEIEIEVWHRKVKSAKSIVQ